MRNKLVYFLFLGVVVFGCERKEEQVTNENSSETSSHYEQLKELNWLVGKWQDVEDDVEVNSLFAWKLNKNFLEQHFYVQREGKKELEGLQTIGWDPIEKLIRSWIFDSEGGYGESFWQKEGDSWYADTNFVLSDGRKATAMHIYTKVDDNTYSFSSKNRVIDGEDMPDIGPVQIVRK